MLPKDPYMLLSVVNTALRDGKYSDLDALAAANGTDAQSILKAMGNIGYRYDKDRRTFLVDNLT